MRAWFLPGAYANAYEARDWESEARTAVATACALAPDLAETHLASAVLAVQRGEWRDAVKSLGRALDIAPTYAHAHQYLAHLQCEAGVLPEGLERARLAYALEPSLRLAMMDVVRVVGLQGDRAGAEAALASIEPGAPFRGALVQARVRLAAYFGDMAAIRAEIDKLGDEGIEGTLFGVLRLARGMLGDASDEEVAGHMRELVAEARSPRFLTMTYQLGAEVAAVRGDVAIALEWFQRAADGGLIDLVWTDRCPLLAPLRGLPGFIAGRRKWIAAIRRDPFARAMRVDKLTLAALEATLALYADPASARAEVPALAMLAVTETALAERAERLSHELAGRLPAITVRVVASSGEVGGGALPLEKLRGPVLEFDAF